MSQEALLRHGTNVTQGNAGGTVSGQHTPTCSPQERGTVAAARPASRSDSGSGSRKTHPAHTEPRPGGGKAGLSLKKQWPLMSQGQEPWKPRGAVPGSLPQATAGHCGQPRARATAEVGWTQPRVAASLCSGGWGDSGRASVWAERGLAAGQKTEGGRGGTHVAEVTAAGVVSSCACAPAGGCVPWVCGHPPQVAKAAAALPTSITPTASIWPSAKGPLLVATRCPREKTGRGHAAPHTARVARLWGPRCRAP